MSSAPLGAKYVPKGHLKSYAQNANLLISCTIIQNVWILCSVRVHTLLHSMENATGVKNHARRVRIFRTMDV